ncbi:Desmoplakin [Collichthys lucidus]|uniref:Desmoplakin n=1 Tax=Collichthys lucidus TaxID=240159 RepID=A0A4U5UL52_COLLU|nr:Desmoplakin [Collichthys lucidus]
MSMYGSQSGLNSMSMGRRVGSRGDLAGAGNVQYLRNEVFQGGGNGYDASMDGYNYNFSKSSGAMGGGMMGTMGGGMMGSSSGSMTVKGGGGMGMGGGTLPGKGGMSGASLPAIHQRAMILQGQCQEYLQKAEYALQTGSSPGDAERFMMMAKDTIEQLKSCAMDLRQLGQPNDSVVRSVEICRDQLKGVHMAMTGSMQRRRSTRGSIGASWEEHGRSFQDAMGWMLQQKRLIETASWGDVPEVIDQHIISHQKFHNSIQRSVELDRARDDLIKKGDKASLHALDQEWDSLQQLSYDRTQQLQELKGIIQEMCQEIMWVNSREEVELVFDWGDKNIEQYIPLKQESYSKLMSALEDKEKELNKLFTKVDALLKNNHPAADKIEAYRDTLQTQWKWLLQITKCIDIHLKENAAYQQFFKEANETYSALQKEHETREKEKILENKRQVQHLANRSKSIVRLKPRNPEEKSSRPVIVKALCDFKQDHKVIQKDNEAILKDNSQRSKWEITGPGGLDMSVPSVCLIVPPPNPLSISLANKNEQYYEAILAIWNQLYINVKSLTAWQYCLLDIKRINSLTISMEFKVSCHGSQMFGDEEKKSIENQITGSQAHYEQLVAKLHIYTEQKRLEQKKEVVIKSEYGSKTSQKKVVYSSWSLSELHALRLRLENTEGTLSQHIHICLGDDGVHDCGLKITELERVQRDIDSMREEYLRLRERILKELEGMKDPDKAEFLRSEVSIINQRLGSLEASSSAYLQRLRALRDMLQSVAEVEDTVKVYEARLAEKETTSLTPSEVEDYMFTLKNMKAELEQKKDALISMEAELAKVSHWNSQVDGSSHRCDMMVAKYTELVNLLTDRWRRIDGQIDTRLQDLQLYVPELQHYKQTSTSLIDWIDATRKKQDALQATKISNIQALIDHINNQKALNTEIKLRRETVDSVLKDNVTCVNCIKDYETDLAAYSSGLETLLLNSPIKRTMLRSPTMDLNLEATQLQTRYMELLTSSGDYYRYLGELLKNMEELKIRNTRIDLLEEELRLLREGIQDGNSKNKSLEEALARYQLQLNQSQEQLLSMEAVQQTSSMQCSAAKESLDSTQSQLSDLSDQVTRLNYLLEEEKRKRRLAEERYAQQQEEYDAVLRKRQKELETVMWSKMEMENSVESKDREIGQLRRQLAEEAARIKELQKEMSKVRSQCSMEINKLKLSYESQIHVSRTDIQRLAAQKEEDTADLQTQCDRMAAERRSLEEELRRLRMSLNEAEEQRKRADEEAHSQRAVITEEGRRRRELESQVEALIRQKDDERSQYVEELAEIRGSLQERCEELTYITHSLEEETRRRKTIEEGHGVLEQTLAQMQVKLTSSSVTATQLGECEGELQTIRLELERESKEKSRVEQNMSRLQGRMKDLQAVRDGLESQVENLRKANQEEVARRRQVETELEKTATSMKEYISTITALRQSQDQSTISERIGEEERLRLQEELEMSLRQNKTSADRMMQLGTELKALQQQLLQEQARVKEANLRNEGLYRTIEERSKALNENSAELQRLKTMTETQTKERLKLEEELRAVRHEREELLISRQGCSDELSSQINALELQLQASERSNVDYRNLVSELSSEREKLKLEAEKIQNQATETTSTIQSMQSKYNDIVMERDSLLLKLQLSGKDSDRYQRLEEELSRIKLSLETELRAKQRIQEENDRFKRDLGYWKDQYESKQGMIRQYDTDKERQEMEKNTLKNEIERLMRELRELEETYKSKLSAIQRELREVTLVRQTIEAELKRAKEPPTLDASNVVFDGVRKPVTADKLLDCGVLDKPTFNQLVNGHKSVHDVSVDKKINLKGTGPIAGVIIEGPKGPGSIAGPLSKMTFTEAKRENLLPPDSADLLLDAQAATGHIIDPRTNQKLTVDEAFNQGVIDEEDRERLLAAEAAAVGYRGPGTSKPLSAFQAMKKRQIDRDTALRLLQAQESVGGILDPVLSVFLPRDTAIERNLIDNDISRALNQRPELYLDPDSEEGVTYMALKRRCKVEPHTGLLLLPVPEKVAPSKLVFEGVRKPVTAKQLVDCGVLDKPTFKDLEKGKKTVPEVSADKNVNLKGTGPIAGVVAGNEGKMSFSEAKKKMLMSDDSADLLLEAQAATGHIIDPRNNEKLTVDEACARGVVDMRDRDRLLAAEAAAVGYNDRSAAKPLSVFEAMKKGVIDRKTGVRLLQAQESTGGILDPNLSVFLPKDTAIKRNLLDENLHQALNQSPECYLDPETEHDAAYGTLKKRCKTEPHTGLLLLPVTAKLDASKLIFDGVRKPVTAQQLLDCEVLDKPTFNQLIKGEKTVQDVSVDKKAFLKGTGSIAGVAPGPLGKMSFTEAKKQMLMPPDSADLLLDAQAATGHIIDPASNKKFTVEEACARGVVDNKDRERLLAAEAAAVGYRDPSTGKPLSVFEAMKKGVIDRKTGLRLLQAQESAGGILDPNLSVFLPRDIAIKRNLLDEDLCHALNKKPECYLDPDTEHDTSYGALKKKSKTESHTGLILLPITERKDPSKLMFDGVRKPVSAQQLFDCGVLGKPTFNQLAKGEKTVPTVSSEKMIYLKGTGSIAGVIVGRQGKMSFSEAKKQDLLSDDCADLLLEAQAATGHIIDPKTDQKLTVDEACARGVVDIRDRDRLLAAEAAAVGYKDLSAAKPLSVFEAMNKGLIDKKTGVRLLQAQESAGGILDPNLSVFLPKDTAIKRNLLDENFCGVLKQNPASYLDPETNRDVSYSALKERCKTEPHTGLQFLPLSEKADPSKLLFDGVRKTVTAQQLLDCGVLDKPTFNQLIKGEKTVQDVSVDKKVFLKGTGAISGVVSGPLGKMSLSEAKKQMRMPPDSADLLLDAQAATGHIIDPASNKKFTVEEACARGVVDNRDRERLLAAEAAAVGYRDPSTGNPLSVFEAMKKGVIDRTTGLRLLQAQESAGGILDPNLSVFLPRDIAIKRNLLDEDLCHELNKKPECYLDPDTEHDTSYGALKKKSKTESHTGLILLPITERKDPSKLMFDGVRKPVSAQQLFDCGVLDKPTFNQLAKGEKTVPTVSSEKMVYLKGTGSIAGVIVGRQGKMSFSEAKKQDLLSDDCADLLLEAQAATGHIIDPKTDQKLTVDEACARGVVDIRDRDRLLAAEAAAVGYKDLSAAKPLSVFEAMNKGLIDKKTGVRMLQAQESAGGILDPNLSVFLPKDTAIKRNLLDENFCGVLKQNPASYLDPETNRDVSYSALKERCKTEPHSGLQFLPLSEKADPSKLLFDGVRKTVTAQQLLDCGVLDKPTFNQLIKGEKTVQDVSVDKKVFLKGTGGISGVVSGPLGKMSFTEAKKQMLIPPDSADLLLDAQAATGHIIDPASNQKFTVEEACARGVVDNKDRERLLAAEAAAVGYRDPSTGKPLSVFEAMKKGVIDRKTGLRLLQAQESAGGILDPNLSVFLPRDIAIKRSLLDEDLCHELNKKPECYLDPDTEHDTSYGALKKKSKTESHTGLILLPITERKDPSKLMFDGVRKPVSAQQLFDCGVLDKPTFNQLAKGEKTVPTVSSEKMIYLKGTGSIAGVIVGCQGKMSFSEAKKQDLLSDDCADLLLEAQAATGHIIDPKTDQKLTVDEACARGVVDIRDRDRLLAVEAAAVGYKDLSAAKPLSVFEAMNKGLIDKKTGVRLLQAQEFAGGILDPNLSVFLPKDTAIKRNLLDENFCGVLKQNPASYLDPETNRDVSYSALKERCKTEPHTGLQFLPLSEKTDPSKLLFEGVRKTVTAQQLLDCGVLDKPTFNQLIKGEKTVQDVSVDKKAFLKGTGSIAGVAPGPLGKMSFTEAKKQMLMPPDSADLLLDAQAATGHIIDPASNQKFTVEEACARGVVDNKDRERLLAAEAAAVGYRDPSTGKPLSVFEAMKKGVIDRTTGLRLLQAQESAGGILDPNLSVFLPRDIAIKRNLLDEDLCHALNKKPECYLDPDTEHDTSYGALKKKSKTESHTGLILLPITERKDPSKLMFDGIRKPVSAQQLFDCGVLDKPTFNQLAKGEKTVPTVSSEKMVYLKGTGSIAGVIVGRQGKMSFSEAKKQDLLSDDCADLLLEAQAATGHIIDPKTDQKLTVDEACARGVVDIRDRDRLLAAEAAAVGYKDRSAAKPLSVFEAMNKGLIDKKTGVRLLQAQESAGGILDPNLSVFLPKDTAIKRNLLDENFCGVLKQNPTSYLDPETNCDVSYSALKERCKTEPHAGLQFLPLSEKADPSKLFFDGVRKTVTAQQLLDCGVLDKPTFNQLIKGEKTLQDVSVDKKVFLKGTGAISGVVSGPLGKMSLSEAKKQMRMPPDSADLLLDAQAATGHIIDPASNKKFTVEEACARGVVDNRDRERLLAAEAAAVGYRDPSTGKPLSVFEAMKKGVIDRKTGLRLLQAQESAGGILDPNLSVFLPRDIAIKRNLLDEDLCHELNKKPECYLDPDTEHDTSYGALKKKSKTESQTGLILLPITERKDPSKLMFVGIRKPVSAQQLFDCGVLDKLTFNQLAKGEKTVPTVSSEKMIYLKGTGSIAGVIVGRQGKMSFSEAKKQDLLSDDCADLLLEAQAATGHIIDPKTDQKLTVDEACARGVVDIRDRDRLLAAEAAAVGYKDRSAAKPLSVFEAMNKGLIDKKTGVRLLQAQESAGGILDPILSVFLPKDTAIKRNLLDENFCGVLKQNPASYLDPETNCDVSYSALKERCKTEPHTGLQFLPLSEKADPSKLLFDGVRKTVTAQQLLDCGVLDKPTFNQLIKGEKTVQDVSVDKKVFLKGTGAISGVVSGPLGKMSFTEAKKQKIMPSDSADMLLYAQAATGYILDLRNNQKLTVKEACARGVVDKKDESMLFAAEGAAVGYRDPNTAKLLSACQAMRKGLIDKDTALRVLQAQQSVGGILDPALSVFLPKDIAKERGLIDEELYEALNQCPQCYLDPDTQQGTTYVSLKKKSKTDPRTGLLLLPEPKKPLTVQGLRGKVLVIDLVDANLLAGSDMDQLRDGRLTSQDIEHRLHPYLRGSTCIAGVYNEANDKTMSIYQAMKEGLLRPGTTLELLEAQAASGFVVDPVKNLYLTVSDAYSKRLFGPEYKDSLLSAERAVTGYKLPGTDKIISLFQAIERGLVEKGHGIRLLQAQIASGGIIDAEHGHRIDTNVAYKRGYFDEKMNKILNDQSDDSKGFFDPNTEENLTYMELQKRCITDKKTGLLLLPIIDIKKKESTLKNTLRKRRVVIVDPETNKEMTVREAYDKKYIDYNTYLELSEQECEWEEITITAPDGSTRFVIIDRKTGRHDNLNKIKNNGNHSAIVTYIVVFIIIFGFVLSDNLNNIKNNGNHSAIVTYIVVFIIIFGFVLSDNLNNIKNNGNHSAIVSYVVVIIINGHVKSFVTNSFQDDHNKNYHCHRAEWLVQQLGEQEPVGAIFDTDSVEKITITEGLNRGLVDSITAQRLLEAQACTGGIVNPTNGKRLGIQEAARQGVIDDDMASKLKLAQKAYVGFEDVKVRKKMSVAVAMKEMWVPYEAGQRFMEFQFVTGGLYDPEADCRRSLDEALRMGWLDVKAAQKLQNLNHHSKILTCPKSKLKISYKEALDNCLVEESTGVKMLQASSMSSRGISSPYNFSSAPGSRTGSRSGSRQGSRRSSMDLGSPSSSRYSQSSFFSFSSSIK